MAPSTATVEEIDQIVLVLKVFENINYLLYSSYYIVLQILILFFL